MTTAGTITTEIANIKSMLATVNLEDPAAQQLQVILNQLQQDLVVANAGNGAGLASVSVGVVTPKGQQIVGANANEPVSRHTKINKNGGVAALCTLLGLS